MAAESGRNSAALKEQLFEVPQRFDFVQIVRILRALDPSGRSQLPADDPSEEFVRFSSPPSLAFPTADVSNIEAPEDESGVPKVDVAFLGLGSGSALGSLPTAYIWLLQEQQRDGDGGLLDFLDIFNHRLVSLYFGVEAKHDPILQYEAGSGGFFERCLSAIAGIGTTGLRGRLSFDDRALLSRAGLIAMTPLPAAALEGVLRSYFEVPFELEQFIPAWFEVAAEDRSRLGTRNSVLGEDIYIGQSVELCQSKFRLRIGPLSWEEHRSFFADAGSFRALLDILYVAAPSDQEFEIQLVLDKDQVPELQLEHRPKDSARLGWSTWLHSDDRSQDREEAVLTRLSAEAASARIPKATSFMEATG